MIERSQRGSSFTEVGAVAGAGESNGAQAYFFRDLTPAAGEKLYRLRQVDMDGSLTFSQVISVVVTPGLTLYPNPATDQLSLAGFAGGWVEVYDGLGRRLLGHSLPADGSLNVENLPPGRYLFRTNEVQRWWVKQ